MQTHLVEELCKKRAQDCYTKLEDLHSETFLICCLATVHVSNNLIDVGESEEMATRWGVRWRGGWLGMS